MSKMKAITGVAFSLMFVAILGLGCSDGNTESRSMEQIYADEGVPVRVQAITPGTFLREAEFTAVLTGIEESSAHAMVADRIEKITARVGDYVAKDSVIVTFPTDNPSANYHQAKVQYENAAATFRRMQQYFEAGGLSQQDFDNAEAAFRVAEADWDAVRQSVKVKAPIAGVLTRLNVRESDNVEEEDELFTVSRTDRLKSTVWVPESEIRAMRAGLPVRATWNDAELTGRVVQADRSVNKQHQAFGVVVEVDNPGSAVPSGVTATVFINTYANDSAVVTQRKNVLRDDDGSYVFVAAGDTAEKRYVTLGQSYLLDVEIVDGLAAGEQLVTEGQLHLKNGSVLKILDDSAASGAMAATEE